MEIKRIGLDLARNVFQVHGVDSHDRVVLRKTLRRDAIVPFFAGLPPCLVGMEACSSCHYWARVLGDLGHEIRLISPQFVTPYVKSNKNDRNDAEAICEAVSRPSMRFVPPKSAEQLEIQAIHRIRQRLVGDRTRLVNQIRGLLAEHGIAIRRDIHHLRRALVQLAEGTRADDGLPELLPERATVCGLAWTGPATEIQRREIATVRHQQAGRPISADPDDPRRTGRTWQGPRQSRSQKPVDRALAGTTAPEYRRRRACQQERQNRLVSAGKRGGIPTGASCSYWLNRVTKRGSSTPYCSNLAGDGERVAPIASRT